MHDPDYRAAFQDFSTFTEKVSEKIMEADETIPELPVKDVVSMVKEVHMTTFTEQIQIYRIYRGNKDVLHVT